MRDLLIRKRKELDLTQVEVAEKLDITRAFYSHIETGTRNPTLKLAKKIADFFDMKIDDIFFDNKRNNSYHNNHSA